MSTRRKWIVLGGLSLALALGFVFTADQMAAGPAFCAFKLVSGLDCPGCGMTRALSALLHGDVDAAVLFHPLVVVVFPVMVALWLTLVVEVGSGRPFMSCVPARVFNRFCVLLVFLFVGTWVFRTVEGLNQDGLQLFQQSAVYRFVQAALL